MTFWAFGEIAVETFFHVYTSHDVQQSVTTRSPVTSRAGHSEVSGPRVHCGTAESGLSNVVEKNPTKFWTSTPTIPGMSSRESWCHNTPLRRNCNFENVLHESVMQTRLVIAVVWFLPPFKTASKCPAVFPRLVSCLLFGSRSPSSHRISWFGCFIAIKYLKNKKKGDCFVLLIFKELICSSRFISAAKLKVAS